MQNSTHQTPLILAIDTTAGRSSVALWQDGVIASQVDEMAGQQSRTLVPMMESVLAQAHKTYQECDAVACALGPGGFTSIRVGIASARAVAFGAHKPLIGLSTLEVMVYASGLTGDVAAVIDAHREQYYAQRFRMSEGGVPVAASQPLLVDRAAMRALAHGAKVTEAPVTAEQVAELACRLWRDGRREFPTDPIYIREPDAKLPSKEAI